MKKISLLLLAALVFVAGSGVYANAVEQRGGISGKREIVERNRHRGHRGRGGRGGGFWFGYNHRPAPRPYYGYYYAPPPPPPPTTYYYSTPSHQYYYPAQPYYGNGGVVVVR